MSSLGSRRGANRPGRRGCQCRIEGTGEQARPIVVLSIGAFVFLPDRDDDNDLFGLVKFVKYAVVSTRPDSQLFRFARDDVISSGSRVFLEFQYCADDAYKSVVVQLKKFFLGRALKP